MKEKIWYEVKISCQNCMAEQPDLNGETLAKVKSKGLAYLVKQLFENIYKDHQPKVWIE